MSSVHFRSSDVDLRVSGSEEFVVRQLLRLSKHMGRVDAAALHAAAAQGAPATPEAPPAPPPAVAEPAPAADRAPAPEEAPPAPPPASAGGARDELAELYASYPAADRDPQADAALLFAYYLQRREGLSSLRVGDLLRCCIRVGVDSRNFHRTIGALTRRGLLQEVRRGESYRISDQGVAAVEERLA